MARKVAFGGIFTALTVVLLYFAAFVPTGRLAAYALCSVPIAFSIVELGVGAGALVYVSTSILSVLLIGSINDLVPFILFFGHYGICKFYIEKQRRAALEIILKLLVFNGSIALAYFVFTRLFLSAAAGILTNSGLLIAGFVLLAQVVFFIYDYVYSRIIFYYQDKRHILWNKGR